MMESVTEIISRQRFEGGAQAYSGAIFERGMRSDGRVVVLKHLPAEGDWLTRATHGLGRARLLWDGGILDEVAATVDHAVLDVVREVDHDVIVMDDVSAHLVVSDGRLARGQVDSLLAGLATLHARWEGCEADGLCTPADRISVFRPSFHDGDAGPNPHPLRRLIPPAWDAFVDLVPDDVGAAIVAVHADPEPLGEELLAAAPPTLLHGDAKLDNLGLRCGRLVAVDWSELTGTGPAEMDLTWFAAMSTMQIPGSTGWRIDATPDELCGAYEAHSQRPLDRRALDLACIGMLCQVGCVLASAVFAHDELARARASRLVDWWVARVREALETWSPA